jgi:AAA+ superfamily predicted ATPase
VTGHIQYIETLSIHEQFRLVEIAHETTDHEIRNLAVQVLQRYLNSMLITMAQCIPTREEYEALTKRRDERSQPSPPS